MPTTVTYRTSATPADLARTAARFFADVCNAAVKARGVARVAISGGTTPKAMFANLADPNQAFLRDVPWSKLQLFWVDERCVPPTEPDSNFRMTKEAMLSSVPLPEAQIFRMEGELKPEVAASRYESTLRNAFRLEGAQTPTFDLIMLGMGDDGHTASLFPHTEALEDITHLVVANHVPQKDVWRVTLTAPVINQGREVAFLIEGDAKAQVVADVFLGPRDSASRPAQLVRPASGRLTLLLDVAAGARLPPTSGPTDNTTLELS